MPGQATVVQYGAGGEERNRSEGFTGITGIAVAGGYLYPSQPVGDALPLPEGTDSPQDEVPPSDGAPGSVVRVSLTDHPGDVGQHLRPAAW